MRNDDIKTRRSVLTGALGCSAVAAVAGVAAFTSFGTGLAPALADKYDHDKIKHAIQAIESARAEIHHSEHTFRGHKEEALAALDAALRHLHVILENE